MQATAQRPLTTTMMLTQGGSACSTVEQHNLMLPPSLQAAVALCARQRAKACLVSSLLPHHLREATKSPTPKGDSTVAQAADSGPGQGLMVFQIAVHLMGQQKRTSDRARQAPVSRTEQCSEQCHVPQ